MSCILWKSKVHYKIYNSPSPLPVLKKRLTSQQSSHQSQFESFLIVCDMASSCGEELLAPHPTPKQRDQPPSSVRNYLFKIFAPTLNIVARLAVHILRTRHAVVTGPKGPTYHGYTNTYYSSKRCTLFFKI